MAEDDEGEEKTQEPSAKRQEEAIEKGQVLVSRDLMVLVVLATGGLQLMMNGPYYFSELVGVFRQDLLFSEPMMRDLPLETALSNAFSGLMIPFLMFAVPISIMLIATQYFFAVAVKFLRRLWFTILGQSEIRPFAQGTR